MVSSTPYEVFAGTHSIIVWHTHAVRCQATATVSTTVSSLRMCAGQCTLSQHRLPHLAGPAVGILDPATMPKDVAPEIMPDLGLASLFGVKGKVGAYWMVGR